MVGHSFLIPALERMKKKVKAAHSNMRRRANSGLEVKVKADNLTYRVRFCP